MTDDSLLDWLDRVGRKYGFVSDAPQAPAAATGPTAAPTTEITFDDEEVEPIVVSALAVAIRAALAGGGINIAIYMIGDPDKNNDKEFKRQAVTWAGNHGAFGLSGSQVKKNHAMALSADPGKLVSDLLAAMQAELGEGESISIANVALFSHGGQRSVQVDSRGSGGGEGWARSSSDVVADFAAAVKPALTAGAKIHLFACSAAKDRDAGKERDDPTRVDSFAEDLQELTGAEVWGHENAAHTTGNSRLVQVTDSDGDANAERYRIRDVLARKLLQRVDPALTEAQMGWLDQTLELGTWIKDSLRFRGSGTKQVDRHQIFIEEVSMMGYDQLFDLLMASSPPGAATFRALFPEHDQIDKLVEGAAAVHARFQKDLEAKKLAIQAARTKPGFPADVDP